MLLLLLLYRLIMIPLLLLIALGLLRQLRREGRRPGATLRVLVLGSPPVTSVLLFAGALVVLPKGRGRGEHPLIAAAVSSP